MNDPLYIEIDAPNDKLRHYPISDSQDHILVGHNSNQCHITIDDPKSAGVHIKISRTGDGNVSILDLFSVNGTKLNDRIISPIAPHPWGIRETITIGSTRLMLKSSNGTMEQYVPEQIIPNGFNSISHSLQRQPFPGSGKRLAQNTMMSTETIEHLIPGAIPPARIAEALGIRKYLVDVLAPRHQMILRGSVLFWFASQFVFWKWWLQPEHITTPMAYVMTSALIVWTFWMTLYFLYHIWGMKMPNPGLKLPTNWRVAMVVTKAPSEPWSVVRKTLEAMLIQDYPHDTWLADEAPTEETENWCAEHGVKISTRNGIAEYHRAEWPRRTKCKEGNLAYFYDHFGYDHYDFVSQLDADHVPEQGYLREILRAFIDPEVGYVSAPSICDVNAAQSWAARGRLYYEANLHGSMEAGYSSNKSSICIGSHYAVRTKALEQCGGIGPELAEDYSTSLLMQAHGWRGVHALQAIAHGDGPLTFADCMTQEFQWSRSLTVLLLTEIPKHLFKLPLKTRFQFFYVLLWYPFFSSNFLLAHTLPIIALLSRTPWANVNYLIFLFFFSVPSLVSLWTNVYVKSFGITRPVNTKILSWETALFQLARWPWVLFGISSAVIGTLLKKNFSFKVTPKGSGETPPLPFRVLVPYILVIVISVLAAILLNGSNDTQGYYYFVLAGMITNWIVIFGIVRNHIREAKVSKKRIYEKKHIRHYLLLLMLAIMIVTAVTKRAPSAFRGITWGLNTASEISEFTEVSQGW